MTTTVRGERQVLVNFTSSGTPMRSQIHTAQLAKVQAAKARAWYAAVESLRVAIEQESGKPCSTWKAETLLRRARVVELQAAGALPDVAGSDARD